MPNKTLIIIMGSREILKFHFCSMQSMNIETEGHKGVIKNVCHESLIRETCFRAYGRKGFYNQELNNWWRYAAWSWPTDMEILTLPGAKIAT